MHKRPSSKISTPVPPSPHTGIASSSTNSVPDFQSSVSSVKKVIALDSKPNSVEGKNATPGGQSARSVKVRKSLDASSWKLPRNVELAGSEKLKATSPGRKTVMKTDSIQGTATLKRKANESIGSNDAKRNFSENRAAISQKSLSAEILEDDPAMTSGSEAVNILTPSKLITKSKGDSNENTDETKLGKPESGMLRISAKITLRDSIDTASENSKSLDASAESLESLKEERSRVISTKDSQIVHTEIYDSVHEPILSTAPADKSEISSNSSQQEQKMPVIKQQIPAPTNTSAPSRETPKDSKSVVKQNNASMDQPSKPRLAEGHKNTVPLHRVNDLICVEAMLFSDSFSKSRPFEVFKNPTTNASIAVDKTPLYSSPVFWPGLVEAVITNPAASSFVWTTPLLINTTQTRNGESVVTVSTAASFHDIAKVVDRKTRKILHKVSYRIRLLYVDNGALPLPEQSLVPARYIRIPSMLIPPGLDSATLNSVCISGNNATRGLRVTPGFDVGIVSLLQAMNFMMRIVWETPPAAFTKSKSGAYVAVFVSGAAVLPGDYVVVKLGGNGGAATDYRIMRVQRIGSDGKATWMVVRECVGKVGREGSGCAVIGSVWDSEYALGATTRVAAADVQTRVYEGFPVIAGDSVGECLVLRA
ncbi:hypothetical protein HDU83_000925 [Entophlyctis luteolus]|nr:hypothetical protein HDU83_000925 [Entophlyctis luteolus]